MTDVITILCHGTDNSTDPSKPFKLVITKIRNLLAGANEMDWILCEGAGSNELNSQQLYMRNDLVERVQGNPSALAQVPRARNLNNPNIQATWAGGVLWGTGVEQNVVRAMNFVANARLSSLNLVVNLAGHNVILVDALRRHR